PDKNDATFLVMAVTDGQENVSTQSEINRITERIRQLQSTDRWTFVFRVPYGGRRILERYGIPSGNIQEWEQTERGFQEATTSNSLGISNYYSNVSRGIRSTETFYTDLAKVGANTMKANMTNISGEVELFPVRARQEIGPFVALKT